LRAGFGSFALYTKTRPRENLSHLLKLEPGQIDEREVRARLCATLGGFSMLTGPQTLSECRELPVAGVDAIMRVLPRLANVILVDLPPYTGEAAAAAVRACQVIGLVLEPDATSVEAARVTLDLLRSLGMGGRTVGAIVVNRSGLATGLTAHDIRAQLGCEIFGNIPRAGEACLTAQERGGTLVSLRSEHVATTALIEMAGRLAVEPVVGMRW